MKTLTLLLLLALFASGCACCDAPCAADPIPADRPGNRTLHQFSLETGTAGWEIEDDAVMGGRSRGRLEINEAGNAVFSGDISLENDGGFSSIQSDFGPIDVSGYRAVHLGLKGDGKPYQVRVEADRDDRHAYAFDFPTSGNWEVVVIPFDEMAAIRHGDRLDLPPYPGRTLSRLQLLFGNGRAESFQIEIDRIWLE